MTEQDAIGMMIKQIHDALSKSANNALRRDDMTLSQAALLLTLYGTADYDLTLKELERALRVSQPTAHGIVKRLREKELVEVSDDCDNQRIKHARLTASGIRQCERGRIEMRKAEDMLTRNLTEKERKQLRILLGKVRDDMR